ncbi:MAG TPA: ABC transporter permease [Gemmatimonadales bacterium]
MIIALALRHLLVRPGRAALLLLGYALGVAVMIVLLSIGDAMLDQSRDVPLIGGGDLTALPHGIDIEAMRTGGLAGMFFGIDGARFVSRELLGGPRHRAMVDAVSPEVTQKLVEVRVHDTTWAVRAAGNIPSEAAAAGAGLRILSGRWVDDSADLEWIAPTREALYDGIDRFHRPPPDASDWAEWDYFNVVVSPAEWWYVTLLVGAENPSGSRGEILVTHRRPDGGYQRFQTITTDSIRIDTAHAALTVGSSSVSQHDGVYDVHGHAGAATFQFSLHPRPHHYFPPVELGHDSIPSGYAVAALAGTASGKFCTAGSCTVVVDRPAYHDHNWGEWRAATWEWGMGHGTSHDLLYGGIIVAEQPGAVPFFLLLDDSIGLEQTYRFRSVTRIGSHHAAGIEGVEAPDSLRILATRTGDSLVITIAVIDAVASRSAPAGKDRAFLQMRGRWRAHGTAAGAAVADSGSGFFETWVPLASAPTTRLKPASHDNGARDH